MAVSAEKFVGGLVDSLLDGDLERVADCYDAPMLIMRPDGRRAFQDRETTLAELSAQAASLADAGAVACRVADSERRYYGGAYLLLDIRWNFLDTRAHTVAELAETYLLHASGDSWKIAAHIIHFDQLAGPAA